MTGREAGSTGFLMQGRSYGTHFRMGVHGACSVWRARKATPSSTARSGGLGGSPTCNVLVCSGDNGDRRETDAGGRDTHRATDRGRATNRARDVLFGFFRTAEFGSAVRSVTSG